MKKLVIDEQTCVCCGSCVANCESVFGWSEEQTPCVKYPENIEKNESAVEEAITACPTGAIRYEEEE